MSVKCVPDLQCPEQAHILEAVGKSPETFTQACIKVVPLHPTTSTESLPLKGGMISLQSSY